jgi:hypothetical protein
MLYRDILSNIYNKTVEQHGPKQKPGSKLVYVRGYQKRIVHTKFDVYVYIIYEYYHWIEVHAIGLLARYNPHSCFDIHIVFGYIYIWTLHFLNDGIKWQLRSVCIDYIDVDIKFSVHDAFLVYPSPGTFKIEKLESQ